MFVTVSAPAFVVIKRLFLLYISFFGVIFFVSDLDRRNKTKTDAPPHDFPVEISPLAAHRALVGEFIPPHFTTSRTGR